MRTTVTCKVCRRLRMSVCGREKCAYKRKPYPPGVHGKVFRRAGSEFGTQLMEKQKVKFLYGLRERQFRNYITDALKQKTMTTGDAVLNNLETRLDNVVYRIGFAPTRAAARQLVNHGHIFVKRNGLSNFGRVNIPSYTLKIGDELRIRPESLKKGPFGNLEISIKKHTPPVWLELDREAYLGKILAYPTSVEDISKGYNISAIVEFYSR